jgi:hypothetical protein
MKNELRCAKTAIGRAKNCNHSRVAIPLYGGYLPATALVTTSQHSRGKTKQDRSLAKTPGVC